QNQVPPEVPPELSPELSPHTLLGLRKVARTKYRVQFRATSLLPTPLAGFPIRPAPTVTSAALDFLVYNHVTVQVFFMALERELAVYKSKLLELKENEGKFVLIHGENVVNVYTSYEDAIKEGYAKFGLQPFLVKQIHAVEQAQFISRL